MTAQFHERLIIDGEKTSMACNPLDTDHPRVILRSAEEREQIEKETMAEGCLPLFGCTACWRDYIGSWEIKGGKLYLLNLDGKYRLSDGPPLFAD